MTTSFTIEISEELDDCERATFVGLLTRTLRDSGNWRDALLFLSVSAYEVRDDAPMTMADRLGTGNIVYIGEGLPSTIQHLEGR